MTTDAEAQQISGQEEGVNDENETDTATTTKTMNPGSDIATATATEVSAPTIAPASASTAASASLLPSEGAALAIASSDVAGPEVDIALLLERIRAKYKLMCSSLGFRGRLGVATGLGEGRSRAGDAGYVATSAAVTGVEAEIRGGIEAGVAGNQKPAVIPGASTTATASESESERAGVVEIGI